jgi:hypothetical protein
MRRGGRARRGPPGARPRGRRPEPSIGVSEDEVAGADLVRVDIREDRPAVPVEDVQVVAAVAELEVGEAVRALGDLDPVAAADVGDDVPASVAAREAERGRRPRGPSSRRSPCRRR